MHILKGATRIVRVLKALAAEAQPVSLTILAGKLNEPASTVHHTLGDLKQEGFVEQDEDTRHYRLGVQMLLLAQQVIERVDLTREAYPRMRFLAQEVGETVTLAVLNGRTAAYVAQVEGMHPIRLHAPIGSEAPLHCTAAGKVLLSHNSDLLHEILGSDLMKFTDSTITNPEALRLEVSRIVEQGYAIDREERHVGLICIAAPVLNARQQVVAALSVSGLSDRIGPEISRFAGLVTDCALQISRRLGTGSSESAGVVMGDANVAPQGRL